MRSSGSGRTSSSGRGGGAQESSRRNFVVVNGLTGTTVLLAALGGYIGWTKFGRSNSSNKADVYAFAAKDEGAGSKSTSGKSSLGYSLSMTKEEIDEALKGLTPFQQSVTMEVSERKKRNTSEWSEMLLLVLMYASVCVWIEI